MKSILFFGTYLSRHRGTKGPGEYVAKQLEQEGYVCLAVSKGNSPLSRATDSIMAALLGRYDTAVLEIYSSRVIYLSWLLSVLLRMRRKPYISILHGGAIPERYPEIRQLITPILHYSAKVVTPSIFIREYFSKQGREMMYLPNPFPIKNFPFKPLQKSLFKLLWVRAFSPIYNPNLAVLILHEVRKTYPVTTLTMVGPDKGDLAKVNSLIVELGLQEAVSIVGPVANDQLYRYFHAHSVYLNTTSYESFGVAVMEAAACGIPIVSSNVGEIPFLWTHEQDILMADILDATAFADQVSRIFEDKDLAQKLSVNARQKAEQYDWQVILPRWIELLERT